MLLTETRKFDITTKVLDPSADAPCRIACNTFVQGSLTDFDTVYNFGKEVDVLTIEIENVNVDALKKLQSEGVKVYPTPQTIELIQNKATQKQLKQRSKFQEAVLYAKSVLANPTQKALYQADHKVKRNLMSAFNVAIADYLNPPVVCRIDVSNYRGKIGDKIYFIILDAISVQSVKVALHQSGGTLIEQGEAVKEGMLYVYTATANQSSFTGSILTVTVTDLPKNVTEKKQTLWSKKKSNLII